MNREDSIQFFVHMSDNIKNIKKTLELLASSMGDLSERVDSIISISEDPRVEQTICLENFHPCENNSNVCVLDGLPATIEQEICNEYSDFKEAGKVINLTEPYIKTVGRFSVLTEGPTNVGHTKGVAAHELNRQYG